MPAKKIHNPWDRWIEQGEGPVAHALFWVFLELGPGKRGLQAVAEESGRKYQTVATLSGKYKWPARARAFDKHLLNIQIKALESVTKSEAQLWAKRELEYRHEAYEFSQKLKAKAQEMLDSPLYETVTETFTEVIVGGQALQVPTKVIMRPVRWNLRDMKAIAELSDQMRRLALGVPTSRASVEVNWIEDPTQRLVQAKIAMAHWVKTRLEAAVSRVCLANPEKDPNEIRAQLLSEVPLWFADHYKITDPTELIEAAPDSESLMVPALSLEEEIPTIG